MDLGDRPQRADGTGQSQHVWMDVLRVEFASQSHEGRDLGLFGAQIAGKCLCVLLWLCAHSPLLRIGLIDPQSRPSYLVWKGSRVLVAWPRRLSGWRGGSPWSW